MGRVKTTSQYRDWQVRRKADEVREYHYDKSRPGQPLHLLVPGGVIALASLACIVMVVYRGWFEEHSTLTEDGAIRLLMLLVPVYIGGVFLFSYGYELYNVERAVRLTAIIVFVTVAAVIIVAVLVALLAGSKNSDSSGKSSSGGSGGDWFASHHSSGSSSGGSWFWSGTPVEINLGSSTAAKAAAVPPPEPLLPVECRFCKSLFVPEDTKFLCPQCGAPVGVEEPA